MKTFLDVMKEASKKYEKFGGYEVDPKWNNMDEIYYGTLYYLYGKVNSRSVDGEVLDILDSIEWTPKIDKRFIDLIDSFFKSNDIDPDGCDANDDYLDYSFANQITEGMVYSFLNEFDVELPYLVRKQLDPEF